MTSTARPRLRAWRLIPLAFGLLAAPLTATAPAAQAGTPSELSSAQRGRAEARRAQFNRDLAALRADRTLTDPQKQAKYGTMMQTMDRDMLAILTPAQRATVLKQRAIGARFKQQAQAIEGSKSLSDAQKKDKIAALAAQADKDTLATLSPAARAEVLKRRQTQEQVQRMRQELERSETPAQKKKIQALLLSVRTQAQAISTDKTLSDAVKGQKLAVLAKQIQSKDLALLSPSQHALYDRIQATAARP